LLAIDHQIVDQRGTIPSPRSYWSLETVAADSVSRFVGSEIDAMNAVREAFANSVRSRMIADRPIGALLSGGIDSSLVVALMQSLSMTPVHTFSIGFKTPAYDEAPYAAQIAKHLGTDHHELYVDAADAVEMIPLMGTIYDEPFADSSQIPMCMVSRLASRDVTVVLSGDGGDEVFCGYNRQVRLLQVEPFVDALPRSIRRAAAWALGRVPQNMLDQQLRQRRVGLRADQFAKLAPLLRA